MECGDALWCQGLQWLSENEYVAETLARTLADYGKQFDGAAGEVLNVIRNHFDKILALAISSLGFYKWWRYREHILHKRLNEFISQGDRRLLDGRDYVLQALQRPAPGQKFKLPLFGDRHLMSVLRERNWDRTPVAASVMSSCELQLSDAMASIQRKIETAELYITSLRQQMATAHVLQGAIHSARTRREAYPQAGNMSALGAFQSALLIPGRDNDIVARELEAHQLRKLQLFPQASRAYEAVEQLAANIPHNRTRLLQVARCKRYRAEIHQAQSSSISPTGSVEFHGSGNANSLLSPTVPDSALDIRQSLQPFHGWDLLEEGDTRYLAAFVAHNLGNYPSRDTRLDEAHAAYASVIATPVRFRNRRKDRHLRSKARQGRDRVAKAKQNPCDFSVDWLSP